MNTTNTIYQATQQVAKRTTSTTEIFDEKGNLITREVFEEVEYTKAPEVLPNPWWQQPLVSNGIQTIPVEHQLITKKDFDNI